MPTFICSKCAMMDNTAVTHYATRPKGSPPLCSVCDPSIGKWHGRFDRNPLPKDCQVGPNGYVYSNDDPYLKMIAGAVPKPKTMQPVDFDLTERLHGIIKDAGRGLFTAKEQALDLGWVERLKLLEEAGPYIMKAWELLERAEETKR